MNKKSAFQLLLLLTTGVFSANSTGAEESSTLRGLAEFKEVSGSAIVTKGRLLPNCRPVDLSCVQVHIKNDSSDVIVADATNATATVSGQTLRAAPLTAMLDNSNCGISKGKKAAVVTTAAFTFGFFGPLTYEALAPKKDLGTAFGKDGTRHESESLHFGRRVIMPGDETTGWLCFDISTKEPPSQVQIPLFSDKARQSGQIILPVATVSP